MANTVTLVLWSSEFLVPALVAAFVTLAIEWAAKPRLEARKERILDRARLRREAITLIHLGHSNYGMLSDFRQAAWSIEAKDLVRIRSKTIRETVADQSHDLVRLGRLLHNEKDPRVFNMLSRLAASFAAIGHSGTLHIDEEILDAEVAISLGLLETSRFSRSGRKYRRLAGSFAEYEQLKHQQDEAESATDS